ncbi:uncharacterized protein KD926_006898 [Aspergillus affinis]|uniref:uncharacterized protein n=1 Tax=Aspergillus affinis TaxID=1070780 RepID=UPI0022FED90C|nr:uncharacterized protein KD926_006898 [Aspergillus affinis]KAI9041322.1 hypothetical protein KD926_006898 [Aspergillus affinis]
MPDLTDLPAELLSEILFLAFGVAPRYEEGYNDKRPLDIKSLSRLLLVNQKHYLEFLPLVYSQWTYNGARHNYSTLWKFFRTAVRNPELISTVKVLNIGNWGLCAPIYLDKNRELQDQDERLQFTVADEETVKIAFQRSGLLGDLASQISDAIFAGRSEYQSRDRRPLMALLLTCFPCVWKVYAHIPASDPFLGAVLQTAIGQQQAGSGRQLTWLPSLKEFYVLCEVPGYFEGSPKLLDDDIYDPSLNLGDIWPIFYLQGLHRVHL